jgi:hypothetical protein
MPNSEQSSIPNKRMIRMPVKRRRDPPDLGLIVGVDRNDTGNAWTAFADRASLIDSERL